MTGRTYAASCFSVYIAAGLGIWLLTGWLADLDTVQRVFVSTQGALGVGCVYILGLFVWTWRW